MASVRPLFLSTIDPTTADMMQDRRPAKDVQEALAQIREREERVPDVALVLGSGLGELADVADDVRTFSTASLAGYPRATVAGHHGRLVFGRLQGRDVLFVQGRAHLYEGHSVQAATFPIRLVHALGARRLLVTNAAGGINPSFRPGTLMFITDQINFAFASPLVGTDPARPRGGAPRALPDMAAPFDRDWTDRAEQIALRLGVPTQRGVYVWTSGPSYETRAEIRMFGRLGADAVGMSTVPEVIQARALGLSVLGISTITNPAAGLGAEPLDHDDVLAVGRRVRGDLERLVRGILRDS